MAKRNTNRIINYTLNKRIEQKYGNDLFNVSSEVDNIVRSFTQKLDTSKQIRIEDVSDLIDALKNYSERISGWAEETAGRMVYSLGSQDLQQWESHAKNMSDLLKKELRRTDTSAILRQYLADNVHLIKSLPLSAAQRVHDMVYRGLTSGRRPASIAKEIMKTGNVTKSRAMLIARTETGRATTGLIKARAEQIGLNWFVWRVTHDKRLRKSHRMMDGVLCTWGDAPNPEALFPEPKIKAYGKYLPGSTFNCRCWAAPLIRASSDVSWPARVHINGRITRMNLKQFLELSGQEFYKKAA